MLRSLLTFAGIATLHLILVVVVMVAFEPRARFVYALLVPTWFVPGARAAVHRLDGISPWLPFVFNSAACGAALTAALEVYRARRNWRRARDGGGDALPRRAPLFALILCVLVPAPFAAVLAFQRPEHKSLPAGEIFATADIRRGNADGDFQVFARGTMVDGRPVFRDVDVRFPRRRAGSLEIRPHSMTFVPFADAVSPSDYRPITREALLAYFVSMGCDPESPGTAELTEALYADLQNVSAGTLPKGRYFTGAVAPREGDEETASMVTVVLAWLLVSAVGIARRSLETAAPLWALRAACPISGRRWSDAAARRMLC